ncbi:HNH endonuclease [Salmonella enterica]|nr:HNH endonuclease [Salmonella enterica]
MPRLRAAPPPDELREKIYYHDGYLYWQPHYRTHNQRRDKPIGAPNSRGYLTTRINVNGVYRTYLVHRLIWWLLYDEWPDLIDHIDRNALNNHITNLREATSKDNSINVTWKSNPTGYLGVMRRGKTYRVGIHLGGKQYLIYGYKTPEAAALARDILSHLFYGQYGDKNLLDKQGLSITKDNAS